MFDLSNFQMKVRIFKNDAATLELKKQLPSYNTLKNILETEVPARQQLNADYGLQKAMEDGVDWLLHLDADELFYLVPPLTLEAHFQALNNDKVGSIIYMNHEGVPEQNENIGDFFHQISLFRRNLNSLTLSNDTHKCVDYWRSRTARNQYMISYDNGKAATRVVPSARAAGVHAWTVSNSDSSENLRDVSSLTDVRTLDLSKLYRCENAFVLHFVVCGLYWYLKKYKILDAFPNAWFGGQLQILPCFHLDSRDRFLSGDFNRLRDAYLSEVVVTDPQVVQNQIDAGVCMRISDISEAICRQHLNIWGTAYQPVSVLIANPDQMKRSSTTAPKDLQQKVTKDENLSLEKMWVLSNLVSQYLTPNGPKE